MKFLVEISLIEKFLVACVVSGHLRLPILMFNILHIAVMVHSS